MEFSAIKTQFSSYVEISRSPCLMYCITHRIHSYHIEIGIVSLGRYIMAPLLVSIERPCIKPCIFFTGPSSSSLSKSRSSDYPGYRIKRKSYPPPDGVMIEEKRPRRPPSPVYSDASGYSKTPTPPPPSNIDDDDF